MDLTKAQLAKMIDHTLLAPNATADEIKQLCAEAKEHNFASVCVQPYYVSLASAELQDSEVKVCTVIGFPHGVNCSETKAFETKKAVEDGAEELDMVINRSALESGEWAYVEEDIKAVVNAAEGNLVKVILESAELSREDLKKVSKLAIDAGADFIKTSTGFAGSGARLEDVKIMKEAIGDRGEIKASGGIRDYEAAKAMIEAGATRIGASAGIKILEDLN